MPELLSHWSQVNWIKANKEVKRLRKRIFQAKKDGNFRKLRNLQRLMLKSSSNILLSIRDVTSNSGKNTAGIDGKKFSDHREKLNLFYEIKNNGYMGKEPMPCKRIYIQEPTKKRPIGIPTIYDRIIQTTVKNSLEPEWETIFEKGSYGFRPGRNVDDAVFRVWNTLNRSGGKKWIVDSDISKCFDSISHKYILEQIKQFAGYKIIEKWLKVGIIFKGVWLGSGEDGTPQGSAISPLLCNISLHGLEEELGVKYTKKGYIQMTSRCLIRFADDLVIICRSKEDALLALEDLKIALKKRGLEISDSKTRVCHMSEGFDFLGYNFKLKQKKHCSMLDSIVLGDDGKYRVNDRNTGVYVSPSVKSVKKVKQKIKEVFKKYSSNMTTIFVRKMNEIIRGYAQSKWHWHSGETFSHLNDYVYKICWRFAKRKHPSKRKKWLVKNYFTSLNLANIKEKWVFYAKFSKDDEFGLYEKYLYKFHWFRIRDYRFGKMDKLPDNKEDSLYFKDLLIERGNKRPFNILYKTDRDLAVSQLHKCPICDQDLYNGETLHIHHIIPKKDGGKTTFSNLVYLHQNCHAKIHNPVQFDSYKNYFTQYKRQHPRIYR